MNYTIIGIDFGTSTTVVKLKNYCEGMNPNDSQSLTFNSNSTIPTLVFKDKNGQLYFGYEAENEANNGTEGTLFKNFKMNLISSNGHRLEAKKLITEFFKYINEEFVRCRNKLNTYPITRTYVSYPAKWTPETRSLMKECAIEAGFGNEDNVFGESEPTAAIYASLLHHTAALQKEHILIKDKPINVLMLDMGAGTSDIAIFKFKINNSNKPVIDELITYPTIDKTYLCGGREVDDKLVSYLCDYIKTMTKDNKIPSAIEKAIRETIKPWKDRNLSPTLDRNESAGLPGNIVPQIGMLQQYGILQEKPFEGIDRSIFEKISNHHWSQLRSLISDSIDEAKNRLSNFKGAEDIDLVILTGGHSQWYGIKEFISGKPYAGLKPINFTKIQNQPEARLMQETHPQETVAHGLIFKDLKFDVKHTMGNSLWIKYTIDGKSSPTFPIAKHNDVLPLTTKKEWELKVAGKSFKTQDIQIKCTCYYGQDIKTAKCYNVNKIVSANDVFGAIGKTVGGVLGSTIVTAFNILSGDWDDIGKDVKEMFDEEYNVKIELATNIIEDESINNRGLIRINEAEEGTQFTIKI